MKIIALTTDGMKFHQSIEVTEISVWIDRTCNHKPSPESLAAVLNEATKSNQMTVTADGSLDGWDSTPLYTNGQRSLVALEVDGEIVWEVYKGAGHSYRLGYEKQRLRAQCRENISRLEATISQKGWPDGYVQNCKNEIAMYQRQIETTLA